MYDVIDKQKIISNVIIRLVINSIKIQNIDDLEYVNFDYVNLNIYFENKLKKKSIIVYVKKNVHVINNLRVKILINIDIICSKKIIINLRTRKFIIDNCDIMIFITCTFVDFKINYIVKFYHVVIISTNSIITISFKIQDFKLLNEKNYFFQLYVISFDFETKNNIITYIINVEIFVIHV